MNLAKRKELERRLVRKLLRSAKAAGWTVAFVDDGEVRQPAKTEEEAMAAVFSVDESRIWFNKFMDARLVRCCAFIVLGNDGWDAIADHSTHPAFQSEVMDAMNAYEDKLAAEVGAA